MTYKTRIGILIVFIALFFVTAPIVFLYTAGYRWNEKKFRLEKVGIIFLRSRPSGADVYLNDKLRSENTPTRLRNLLPDAYTVKVTKPGYTTWSKKLQVESARATFAEGIIIWKEASPEKLTLAPEKALTQNELTELKRVNQLSYKVDNETFKSDGFEIWVESKDNEHETVTRLSEEILAIMPYADTGWVIYETANSIHAIERDGRDNRNDITLATGNDLNGLAISSDGKSLFYMTGKGTGNTLWRRLLQ